jgi:hypothetical protein
MSERLAVPLAALSGLYDLFAELDRAASRSRCLAERFVEAEQIGFGARDIPAASAETDGDRLMRLIRECSA